MNVSRDGRGAKTTRIKTPTFESDIFIRPVDNNAGMMGVRTMRIAGPYWGKISAFILSFALELGFYAFGFCAKGRCFYL